MSNERNLRGAGPGGGTSGPLTLAVDTATERRSVAVMRGGQVLAERSSGLREDERARLLAAANFGAEPVAADLPAALRGAARLLVSTDPRRGAGEVRLDALELAAGEAVLVAL